ncbi:MAG: hypothetical protein Q7S40_32435 [Opitutaceae bacterium]|nr:hypothetical protein [Opitutaceae bacterium]
MITQKKSRKNERNRSPKKHGKELFWVRPGHPDLDRAGDLLLEKLAEIRLESKSRGTAG